MKILQVHNKYKKRGGEETVVEEERKLLELKGHKVIQYLKYSAELEAYSKPQLARLMFNQRFSRTTAKEFKQLLTESKPDICHVHNIYPIITPAIFEICYEMHIPVVQTLHNYKLICTNSLLFREGEVCEVCVGKSLYNSIKYKCYRGSVLITALTADAIQHHRREGTWGQKIDKYVCLTEFQKSKMMEGGIPSEKIVVKPNFMEPVSNPINYGDDLLFVGRLDDSKGLQDLLFAIEHSSNCRFTIIGESDDPSLFKSYKNVQYLGLQPRDVVLKKMASCRAVLFPSKYYEGMPMVILEAFSLAKPVIARNIGAMSSMIQNRGNGISYDNRQGLLEAVKALENEKLAKELGLGAQLDFMKNYTREIGYKNLMKLYQQVLNEKHGL